MKKVKKTVIGNFRLEMKILKHELEVGAWPQVNYVNW